METGHPRGSGVTTPSHQHFVPLEHTGAACSLSQAGEQGTIGDRLAEQSVRDTPGPCTLGTLYMNCQVQPFQMAKSELWCKEWQTEWIWLFPNAASSPGSERGKGQVPHLWCWASLHGFAQKMCVLSCCWCPTRPQHLLVPSCCDKESLQISKMENKQEKNCSFVFPH